MLGDGTVASQAAEVAATLAEAGVSAVHGYFAHRPAEVAAVAARLLGVPYGFSVHALDARKVTAEELRARAAGASVVLACNDDVATTVSAVGARPRLVRHGVDLAAFPATPPSSSVPVVVLAVGRFVEKKGFDTLLAAVAKVERNLLLRLVGQGPLEGDLVAQARRLGLDERVSIEPPRTHDSLPDCYAAADLVVVPSIVDSAGDRDGLPNVVLEAMASGRPVVASDVGAIADRCARRRHWAPGAAGRPGRVGRRDHRAHRPARPPPVVRRPRPGRRRDRLRARGPRGGVLRRAGGNACLSRPSATCSRDIPVARSCSSRARSGAWSSSRSRSACS